MKVLSSNFRFLLFFITLAEATGVETDAKFLSQLNERMEKIEVLRKSMNEGPSPKERLTRKHEIFLKKIEKQISTQEFAAIKASLEASRETSASEMDKLYEDRLTRANNKISPKLKEEIERTTDAFDQIVKKSIADVPSSGTKDATASNDKTITRPQRAKSLEISNDPSVVSEEFPSQKATREFKEGPVDLRPEDYELQEYSPQKFDLAPYDGDSLFTIVSKAYKRNIRRIKQPKEGSSDEENGQRHRSFKTQFQ